MDCLICLNQFPPEVRKIRESSPDNQFLKSTLEKIFQYLLVPSKDVQTLNSALESSFSPPPFCSSCIPLVEEIAQLQQKIASLELQIQLKVETLGKALAGSVKFQIQSKKRSNKAQIVWEKFQNPVIQNYAKGNLPKLQSKVLPLVVPPIYENCLHPKCSHKIKIQTLSDGKLAYSRAKHEIDAHYIQEHCLVKIQPKLTQANKMPETETEPTSPPKSDSLPPPPQIKSMVNLFSQAAKGIQPRIELHRPSILSPSKNPSTTTSSNSDIYQDCPYCFHRIKIETLIDGRLAYSRAKYYMDAHFFAVHCPIQIEDLILLNNREKLYACPAPQCKFQCLVKDGATQLYVRKKNAILEVGRHFMETHPDQTQKQYQRNLDSNSVPQNQTPNATKTSLQSNSLVPSNSYLPTKSAQQSVKNLKRRIRKKLKDEDELTKTMMDNFKRLEEIKKAKEGGFKEDGQSNGDDQFNCFEEVKIEAVGGTMETASFEEDDHHIDFDWKEEEPFMKNEIKDEIDIDLHEEDGTCRMDFLQVDSDLSKH